MGDGRGRVGGREKWCWEMRVRWLVYMGESWMEG